MIFKTSRYLRTRPIYNKTTILETRSKYTFNKAKCQTHTFMQGDTLDILSTKAYGTPALWFAILDANPIYLSETDIKIGERILIPDYREAVRLLG